jgi:hypothetical protein
MIAVELAELCKIKNIPFTVVRHRPTRSAAETQAVLPRDCLVQKTITCKLADRTTDKLVLWTGVADYRINRSLHKQAAKLLQLKRVQRQTFNPNEIDPLQFYGVPEGAVNPFLLQYSPAISKLDAILFLAWPKVWNEKYKVAISLSLEESLLISLCQLQNLLLSYKERVFPNLNLFDLEENPTYVCSETGSGAKKRDSVILDTFG